MLNLFKIRLQYLILTSIDDAIYLKICEANVRNTFFSYVFSLERRRKVMMNERLL